MLFPLREQPLNDRGFIQGLSYGPYLGRDQIKRTLAINCHSSIQIQCVQWVSRLDLLCTLGSTFSASLRGLTPSSPFFELTRQGSAIKRPWMLSFGRLRFSFLSLLQWSEESRQQKMSRPIQRHHVKIPLRPYGITKSYSRESKYWSIRLGDKRCNFVGRHNRGMGVYHIFSHWLKKQWNLKI